MLTQSTNALRDRIQMSISMLDYENALFFAERLQNISSNPDDIYFLAKCYYLNGKIKQSYLVLRGSAAHQCQDVRLLLARCCIELKKYGEAERALLSSDRVGPKTLTKQMLDEIPGGSSGLYLLGLACKFQNRSETAIEYFRLCLQVQKFLHIV